MLIERSQKLHHLKFLWDLHYGKEVHLNVFRNCSNFRKVYARLELKMTKLNHSPTGVLQQQQQQQYYRISALNLRRHVTFCSKYTIQGPLTDSYDEETFQNFH